MPITTELDAKKRIQRIVLKVKDEMGQHFSSNYRGIDDPVAKYLKIKIVERKLDYGDGGLYLPNKEPIIAIDVHSASQERLNFTYFHEICHHLINNDGELHNFLDGFELKDKDFHSTIEKYCNIGTAEFLVPQKKINKIINKRGFTIEMIRELDEVFPASKPAIMIQMAQCASHECILVVCDFGIIPKRIEDPAPIIKSTIYPQSHLFVQYSSSSPSCKYSTGRYIPVPKEHFLTGVFARKDFATGNDIILFRSNTKWRVNCEGFFYKGKVYGVFNITDPNSPQQMKLPGI